VCRLASHVLVPETWIFHVRYFRRENNHSSPILNLVLFFAMKSGRAKFVYCAGIVFVYGIGTLTGGFDNSP